MDHAGSLRLTTAIDELQVRLERERVVTVTLGELRERLARVNRLGKHVLGTIRTTLDNNGVGYFPQSALSDDQPRQQTLVRLFLRDSLEGKVVNAILHPTEEGDVVLRTLSPSSVDISVEPNELRELLLLLESGVGLLQDVLENRQAADS